MKKSTKTSIITGIIIAVIGIVVVLCALGMSGWKFKNIRKWESQSVAFDTPITKLKMEVNAGQATVTRGATDKIVVTYDYDDAYQPEITTKDNGNVLSVVTGKKHWYEFNFWFGNAPTIKIEIPQDWTPNVYVTLNAGSLSIGNGDWSELMEVELNAGAVSIGDVTVEELRIDINAGALEMGKIVSNKVTCNISAGAFTVKEITCSTFECDVSAGGANVKKLDASRIKVDVSAGSANLGLVGAKSDYSIGVDKSAGSCNVTTQTSASASRSLHVDISAGSVEVSFGK
ncbi:MAG: DUF4097 family beta strand repeat protein [Clostridiales bacterium]|nr:DUF4097 family beta strand repeat protein [Clostridiales bacterium]